MVEREESGREKIERECIVEAARVVNTGWRHTAVRVAAFVCDVSSSQLMFMTCCAAFCVLLKIELLIVRDVV